MISSQGKKQLSLTMQIWNWNGKKEQSGLRTEWMSLFWHGFFTIYAFGIRFETSLGKPWVLIDAFFFYFDDIQAKGFFSDCLPFKKNLQFPFRLFRNSLHFTPLINPSWVELSQEVVQGAKTTVCVMNHGDLHSPPHFVIPFEIFLPTSLCYCRSNSKLLEVYTIVKVYTEKKLRNFFPLLLKSY